MEITSSVRVCVCANERMHSFEGVCVCVFHLCNDVATQFLAKDRAERWTGEWTSLFLKAFVKYLMKYL